MKEWKYISTILGAALALGWGAVMTAQDGPIPKSDSGAAAKGFRFRGGDAGQGKEAFARLNCIQCHTVSGVEVPKPEGQTEI